LLDAHWPAAVQVPPVPQGVPSGFSGFEHSPVGGAQDPTSWHESDAIHVTGFEPVQDPDWQVSVCVQALPSLHDVPFDASPFAGHAPELPVQVSATSH
jgi:hypothetical protein